MTATQIRPAGRLSPLVAGIRTAVESHADWAETAQLVADQLRRHLPTPDVLTAEQRLGSPDGYRGHTLHVEPDGSFSIVALVWRPGQLTRIHDHVTWCVVRCHPGCRARGAVRRRPATWSAAATTTSATSAASRRRATSTACTTPLTTTAISIHVYGTDVTRIGSSARRYYD